MAAFKGLVAVGLWVDISVTIYSLEMHEVWKEQLREDILPRSLVFGTLEGIDYLFVGLADGHLIVYTLPEFERKSIVLGNRQIKLSKFTIGDQNYVFAASDQPTIIYSFYQRIFYASVNTGAVDDMAPFHSTEFPECIALIAGSSLSMVSIEEIQRISSWACPMEMTVRRIQPVQEFFVCIGSDQASRAIILSSQDLTVQSSL